MMERVADWQLAHPSKHPPTDWTQAAAAVGFMALARISSSSRFYEAMMKMGDENRWQVGPRVYDADDHSIGQTYAELYLLHRDPKMIAPLRERFDYILTHPKDDDLQTRPGIFDHDRWSWCDSLFMAPPAWARLYAVTGKKAYLDFMVEKWWETSDYLYDKDEHLYFRDSTYFDKREANDRKVFWSRGNGWVMGGLMRVLQYLPKDHRSRPRFIQQFSEMAEKIRTVQQSDGFWRASLLDPASYPIGETSGTGFYVYALTWGINQGLLDRAKFQPVVLKGWHALVSCVQKDGKLTHVQPIGADPKRFDENSTEIYGVGAFLLAGSEIYRLVSGAKPIDPVLAEAFMEMRAFWDRPVTQSTQSPPLKGTRQKALFRQAEANARRASEAFFRSRRYVDGWLAHADPVTGLIPRNFYDSDYWNGRDSAADNYPFMVLTASMTDRQLMQARLLDMLRTEERLTARVDRLTDDYSFTKRGWRRETFDLDETIFDSAEYVKDGLIPLTEWLGPSPWSKRMTGLLDDIWKHAQIQTSSGPIPTLNFEVNGDLLQSCARVYWLTGDPKYLDWATPLGDYYLLGKHHPTRDMTKLRLRDHGGEVLNGLTELYLALRHVRPEKARAYRVPLHEIFDRILKMGRNEDGMLYDWFNPQTGEHSEGLCDTWGYIYDGFYTMYLLDGTKAYWEAVLKAMNNLGHYRNYDWEKGSADGYADSIESAINLFNREPVSGVGEWLDSEIRVMWAKQQPDGVIEGWHGDGNFARTTLMYALWKTGGLTIEPWREDVQFGAVRGEDGRLYVSISADKAWSGRLIFDRARHRVNLHLPVDYPRINQFAEWFTAEGNDRYTVTAVPTFCYALTIAR